MKKFLKKPLGWLCCGLVVLILLSFLACIVNTGGFSYSVTKVTADMDALYTEEYGEATAKPMRMTIGTNKDGMVNAKLTGYIYMPKGVDENNPAPCICVTHGYLNSKEFMEAQAIEMARRGYIVFAFDQYDHGDSTWDTPSQFNFYVWSVYDAVEYMYSQKYVLKDADGNGMIAVSGHSMGGFSSELAVAWDEMNVNLYHVHTYRMISVLLAMGADFRYDDGYVSGYSGGYYASTYNTYNTRSCGTLYGQYDEFFFDNDSKQNSAGNTVIEKDYAKDSKGYGMLGLTKAGENNKWYKVNPTTNTASDAPETGYGERILIQVKGDHPYNTWSPEATSQEISFYEHAFAYQLQLHGLKTLADYGIKTIKGQTWWLKDVFTCLGLLVFVFMMICAVMVLADLPLLRKVTTESYATLDVKNTSKTRKWIGVGVTIFSLLLSMYLIPAFMNRSGDALTLVSTIGKYSLYACGLVGIAIVIIGIIMKVKGEDVSDNARKALAKAAVGVTTIALVAVVLRWLVTDGTDIITSGSKYWCAPSVNTIVYWAMASGLLGLLFTLINHFIINEDRNYEHLGLKAQWSQVGLALLIAIAVSVVGWLLLVIIQAIFNTDFRVYTYAFNSVTWTQFVTALKYIPLFFVFYLCAGLGIASATAGKKGIKADLIAIAIEVIPCALFLLYQYGVLLATGTAAYPSFALNGILVQGLIFTLIFLGVIQRRTLEKTGNIWTGVFLNTIWFTMITIASTCVYMLAQLI